MKTFKKITSMITALTMLSAMTVLPTSAVQTTEYTVSYDTLTQAIQTEDGSTVPAGSVAVTVSVSGNIGFDANTFNLDIGEDNSILTNLEGNPIITKEHAFGDALVAAATDDSQVCVTAAMSSFFRSNGELFTFYLANGASEDVEITSTNEEALLIMGGSLSGEPDATNLIIEYHPPYMEYYYLSGDATNDNLVNANDATAIYQGISAAGGGEINVVNDPVSTYFPNISFASQPDANQSGWINTYDATAVLQYAASVGVGTIPSGSVGEKKLGMRMYIPNTQ